MKRNTNIDIIKIFAVLFVICVHFFLHTDFYQLNIYGLRSYVYILMQNIFLSCVPLFVLSTGYLLCNKNKVNKDYFKKLIKKIIIPFLVICTMCVLFKKFYLEETINLDVILTVINTNGWYIGFYICLYCLIPIINKMLNNLDKDDIKYLLIVLFVFGPLLSIVNIKHAFIVGYYKYLWMFNFYIFGYYIKKYGLKINIKYNLLLFLIIPLISLYNYYISVKLNNGLFYVNIINDWGGITPYINSLIIFIFIINRKIIINNKIVNKIICSISDVTMDIYLLSFIFDALIYKYFPSDIYNAIYYFPIITICVFISSYVVSLIIEYVLNKIIKINI